MAGRGRAGWAGHPGRRLSCDESRGCLTPWMQAGRATNGARNAASLRARNTPPAGQTHYSWGQAAARRSRPLGSGSHSEQSNGAIEPGDRSFRQRQEMGHQASVPEQKQRTHENTPPAPWTSTSVQTWRETGSRSIRSAPNPCPHQPDCGVRGKRGGHRSSSAVGSRGSALSLSLLASV